MDDTLAQALRRALAAIDAGPEAPQLMDLEALKGELRALLGSAEDTMHLAVLEMQRHDAEWQGLELHWRAKALLPGINREQFNAAMKIGFDHGWSARGRSFSFSAQTGQNFERTPHEPRPCGAPCLGTLRPSSNGYNTFLRCDVCDRVPLQDCAREKVE